MAVLPSGPTDTSDLWDKMPQAQGVVGSGSAEDARQSTDPLVKKLSREQARRKPAVPCS